MVSPASPRPPRRRVRRAGAGPLVAVVLVVAVLVAGCSSKQSDAGADEPSVGSAATVDASSTTTTTTAPTTTTTTSPPAVGKPDARDVAQTLYDAWVANDRALAATVADQPAIDGMFTAIPGPYQLYSGCDTGEFDTGGCLFRDRSTNNTIQVDLEKRNGNWVAAFAYFSTG